ncbi:TetR family transcriptional regulator [Amycolatopsis mediterranei S699]|uniref:TetR family transcriptional regulator n=2 Tax=Amycolatopsis mediterranei TaxID=33910 RepID=A0A0H3CY49_AMYMU|nr:TetR/AcrR family transcriptional regulator [Amycolatopsis mediterranei]ADJ43253.1 TetR family transcriptional regulator [Amycolatopsis mediterranei U32]AEK39951.1 TetR family transcriptional regulator [Amycolatopsis mediterranei S699]AFO74967.1 TetR family transcriptional regulator [Amycolatopsis mediterranei S699]AGT82096.1 TetR family transcriptional regulator [Amycolatopsis mediterranei RB]KDO05165.1 TetR family transcriptional regulator [Amycolatopsis mediterranei]
MPRWEPHARERLEAAALELFAAHGYQAVTVPRIAERAGLTKPSYFRHFADKREVLFFGQELVLEAIKQAVEAAPEGASPRRLVEAALDGAAVLFTPARRARAAARQEIIESEPELRECLTGKRSAIAGTITAAVQDRGTPRPTALVAGQLGLLAFVAAHERWAASTGGDDFAGYARDSLDEAIKAAASLL